MTAIALPRYPKLRLRRLTFGPVFGRPFAPVFDRGLDAAAAVPYSLYYDGSNRYVDLNAAATIDDLLAGDCTVDVYWQATTASAPAGASVLVGQMGASLTSGWIVYVSNYMGSACWLLSSDGAGLYAQVARTFTWTQNAWYYVRARKASGSLYISVNTVAENAPRAIPGYTATAVAVTLGNTSDLSRDFTGRICYVHLWNTNKGNIASVPTSPIAVDANTVGRWTHSDGSGITLTDSSSNGNNGTISGATWSTTVPAGWTL